MRTPRARRDTSNCRLPQAAGPTTFRKGQSCNPGGRPRGMTRGQAAALLEKKLHRRVKVQNGKESRDHAGAELTVLKSAMPGGTAQVPVPESRRRGSSGVRGLLGFQCRYGKRPRDSGFSCDPSARKIRPARGGASVMHKKARLRPVLIELYRQIIKSEIVASDAEHPRKSRFGSAIRDGSLTKYDLTTARAHGSPRPSTGRTRPDQSKPQGAEATAGALRFVRSVLSTPITWMGHHDLRAAIAVDSI